MKVRRFISRNRRMSSLGKYEWSIKCGCRFVVYYNEGDEGIDRKLDYMRYQSYQEHEMFGCSLGSELTEKQKASKKKGYFIRYRLMWLYGALHDRGLGIPRELGKLWNIKYPDVWNSETKYGKQKVFKFSYHVKTGELLIAPYGIHHNIMILNYGRFPFKEYVRGIFFREKRIIYLRMHENKKWLKKTEGILRINELPKSIRVMYGEKAAKKLSKDLEGL